MQCYRCLCSQHSTTSYWCQYIYLSCPLQLDAADYNAQRYDNSVSQIFLRDLARTLFSYDMVFMPFNFAQHWILLVIMNKKQEFHILDSLWNLSMYESQIKKLVNGIASIASSIPTAPQNVGKWKIIQKENRPMQKDGYSCGLYVIKYTEHWNGSKFLKKFSQADIERLRKEMAGDIILSAANEVHKVKEEVQALMHHEEEDDVE